MDDGFAVFVVREDVAFDWGQVGDFFGHGAECFVGCHVWAGWIDVGCKTRESMCLGALEVRRLWKTWERVGVLVAYGFTVKLCKETSEKILSIENDEISRKLDVRMDAADVSSLLQSPNRE